jgi:hypothetical protein
MQLAFLKIVWSFNAGTKVRSFVPAPAGSGQSK